MTRRSAIILALVLLSVAVLIGGTALWLGGERATVRIGQAQLRAEMDKRFPVERPVFLLLNYRLSDPRLTLLPDTSRVALGLSIGLNARLDGERSNLQGSIDVETGLRYDAAAGALFLVDPVITDLELDGVPERHLSRVHDGARLVLAELFSRYPAYTLDRGDLRQQAVKLVLRSLRVEGDAVVLELGVP